MRVLEERNLASCRCRVVDLTCRRGSRVVFAGVDFALHAGDLARVRGPNGSGKSTLLKAMAGLITPARGTVERAAEAPVSYVGHANALNEGLTAREALRFLARLHRSPCDDTRVDIALRRLGVGAVAHQPVRSLSQGQRRRVALARLALHDDARLWLLDEPFDALDDAGIAAVDALIVEQRSRGSAFAVAAHGERALRLQPSVDVALGATH